MTRIAAIASEDDTRRQKRPAVTTLSTLAGHVLVRALRFAGLRRPVRSCR